MKSRKEILEQVVREAQKIEIPESIHPKNMRKRLEAHVYEEDIVEEEGRIALEREAKEKGRRKIRPYYRKALLTAAGLLIILGGGIWLGRATDFRKGDSSGIRTDSSASQQEAAEEAGASLQLTADVTAGREEELGFGEASYEEIYASMLSQWESQYSYLDRNETAAGGTIPSENVIMEPAEGGIAEDIIQDLPGTVAENSVSIQYAESQKEMAAGAAVEEGAVEDLLAGTGYGTTNIQTVGVDEGDIVKNDGRYLYQIINRETEEGWQQAIQIVDTKDGLSQTSHLNGFENIQEFYVRENRLIVIENKSHLYTTYNNSAVRKAWYNVDVNDKNSIYHEISFYDLKDKSNPLLLKKFTLEGSYTTSRIADGYFYGFSRYWAAPGEGKEDYKAYIPQIDGKCLEPGEILLPKESKGTSYLVFVSVDLDDPTQFVQTRAVVSTGDMYYVSGENIYITSFREAEEQEGWSSTTTDILKFSYQEGKFSLKAQGTIKGQLESSFSLDEYEGYLRAVTTVREYNMSQLVDDRTGKSFGYELLQEKETNALYVLDENLKMTGCIEGLAEDERVYSARFFGETGYFVTFRQTDPLYAVDLSDPVRPKILSELKISGFSEYLHLYGTDRLLGIGMEADEETGRQEGMKLSMFDISDPTNVQEVSKLALEKYNYSEALYNHKAVLISPSANIFGFEAEGYEGKYQKKYLVFSYDEEKEVFRKEMELEAVDAEGDFCQARGTFIEEIFYLLCNDGSITSYDRNTGKKLDRLTPSQSENP